MSDNFVVVGNIGDLGKFEKGLPELLKYNPGLLLVTGGLPVGQLKEAYELLASVNKRYGVAIEVTPGPEDFKSPDTYRKLFGEPTASFVWGGVKFICLDSSPGKLEKKPLEFLDRNLTSPSFIFTHCPPAVGFWEFEAMKDGDSFLNILSERSNLVLGAFFGRIKTLGQEKLIASGLILPIPAWVVGNATEGYEISKFGYSRAGKTGGLAVLMKGGRSTFEVITQSEAVV